MSNYSATVVQLGPVHKHSNADKLQCVNIFGNNVIVGLDAKEGDTGLFFPLEAQIGLEFAQVNDLIRRKDENGKSVGGMFDQNRRVRAQTLRGEKSMGFFCPLSYLTKLNPNASLPNVGDEIETWGGFEISKKYVVPTEQVSTTGKQGKPSKKSESRLVDGQFHFHFDTSHLGKNLHRINPESLIAITWKLHGTSGSVQRCLVKKPLKWYEKALQKIGVNIVDTEYDYLYASRKVIKNSSMNKGPGYYSEDLWTKIGENFKNKHKLLEGESVYYECVGYTSDGGYIQKPFDYGCEVGQNKVYVYRITRTSHNGVVTELSWPQVKERCKEIGVEHVPEIYYGSVGGFINKFLEIDQALSEYRFINGEYGFEKESLKQSEVFFDMLKKNYIRDQDCHLCKNKVPAEGIVVRLEGLNIENFKLKSFRFLGYETKQLDSGEADMESSQSGE